MRSAANIDSAWIGFDAVAHLHDVLDHPVVVVNDADAAGIGEMYYGAARGHEGLVVLTTLGTGIGTGPHPRRRAHSQLRARTPRGRRP